MNKYTMTCTCGHEMEEMANSRAEAVTALKNKMTEETIAAHMKEMHKPDEVVPSVAEVHAGIEQMMKPME